MDDRRTRTRALGDARAAGGSHAWLPALAQPARAREDDLAEVSGIRTRAHPGRDTRTRNHRESDRGTGEWRLGAHLSAGDRSDLPRHRTRARCRVHAVAVLGLR